MQVFLDQLMLLVYWQMVNNQLSGRGEASVCSVSRLVFTKLDTPMVASCKLPI